MIEGLTFEPEGHQYFYNGVRVPNVTSVLNVIDETWRIDPEVLQAAADLGTDVHLTCELDDNDDLDEESLDEQLRPFLEAWRRFRLETGFTPCATETRIWHPAYRYAGTLDRKGRFAKKPERLALIDIKSGSHWPSHGPQTAAYTAAEEARLKEKIHERYCCYLSKTGTYRLVPQTRKTDFATFLACLHIHHFHEDHAR